MRYIIVLSMFLVAGCSQTIDTFSITNLSDKDIFIEKIEGFSRVPVVDYVSSGSNASNVGMDTTMIGACKIYWVFSKGINDGIPDAYTTTPCDLGELGGLNVKGISFTFTENRKWEFKQWAE